MEFEKIKNLQKKSFTSIKKLYEYIRQWGIEQEDICAIIPNVYIFGLCIDYILLYWEENY